MMALPVDGFVFGCIAMLAGSLASAFVAGPALRPPFGTQNFRCSPLHETLVAAADVGSKYFQLQEMEDGESATTAVFLKADGQIDFFESDGPIALSYGGDWAQNGEDVTMIITRIFEAGHEERDDTDMGEFVFEVERTFKGRVTNVGDSIAVEGTIHDMDELFGDRKIGFFSMIDTTEDRLKYTGGHAPSAINAGGSTGAPAQKAGKIAPSNGDVNGKSQPVANAGLNEQKGVVEIEVSATVERGDFPNLFGNKEVVKPVNDAMKDVVEPVNGTMKNVSKAVKYATSSLPNQFEKKEAGEPANGRMKDVVEPANNAVDEFGAAKSSLLESLHQEREKQEKVVPAVVAAPPSYDWRTSTPLPQSAVPDVAQSRTATIEDSPKTESALANGQESVKKSDRTSIPISLPKKEKPKSPAAPPTYDWRASIPITPSPVPDVAQSHTGSVGDKANTEPAAANSQVRVEKSDPISSPVSLPKREPEKPNSPAAPPSYDWRASTPITQTGSAKTKPAMATSHDSVKKSDRTSIPISLPKKEPEKPKSPAAPPSYDWRASTPITQSTVPDVAESRTGTIKDSAKKEPEKPKSPAAPPSYDWRASTPITQPTVPDVAQSHTGSVGDKANMESAVVNSQERVEKSDPISSPVSLPKKEPEKPKAPAPATYDWRASTPITQSTVSDVAESRTGTLEDSTHTKPVEKSYPGREKISQNFFRNYLESLSKNHLKEPKIAGGYIIDEEARLSQSSFPIPPADLIELAKNVLRVSGGLNDESVLADDFEFFAPTYGPVSRENYLGTHVSAEINNAFPDFDNQYYNFHVDPFEFNRVWYNVRPKATHTAALKGVKATGKKLQLPPQAQSLVFNEDGKVTVMTIGYVMDKRVGNTGGMGGTYGLINGVRNA